MHQVLNEDILPALEKLRREKDQYYQWQAATANLDVLRRFCIAYKHVEAQRYLVQHASHVEKLGWIVNISQTNFAIPCWQRSASRNALPLAGILKHV